MKQNSVIAMLASAGVVSLAPSVMALANQHVSNGVPLVQALCMASDAIQPYGTGLQHGQVVALENETRFNESYFSRPLTTYATGWRDQSPIQQTVDFLFPRVTVNRRFEYAAWTNAEEFLSETFDDARAIGSDFKRVEYTSSKVNAKTENRGLMMRVDLDEVAEKEGWETLYTGKLLRRLIRNRLRRYAALAAAASTNTAKTWDGTAGKDPDKDVETDLIAAQTASGMFPNRVLYGHTAWDKRRLSHRAQNTAGGFASAGLTPEGLASYLNVEGVMVSRERYQSAAAAKSEIVSNLVLEFMGNSDSSTEDASNYKQFITPIAGAGDFRVFTMQVSAKLYDIVVECYETGKVVTTLGARKLTIS